MKINIWELIMIIGLALMFGTVCAADMGAIGAGRIVCQIVVGIVFSMVGFCKAVEVAAKAKKKRRK